MEWDTNETVARAYYDFCLKASQDDNTLSYFKTCGAYTSILSHVSEIEGAWYMEAIKANYPDLLNDTRFLINDKIGGAPHDNPSRKFQMTADNMSVDPTTLRYLKQTGDIISFCNPSSVVEIGGGYGGLQLVLKQYCNVQSYYNYDHPSPIKLAKVYLGKYDIQIDDVERDEYDLVVSSFAWDELHEDIREMYIDKVFSRAKNGYIVARKSIYQPQYDRIMNAVGKKVHTSTYSPNASHYDIIIWKQ
jgi:hypothetical protein